MYYTIYKTTNLINNKEYIGAHQTQNPNDNYIGSGVAFQYAVKKYGKINFKKEIIFYARSLDIMYWVESLIVDNDYIKNSNNYNLQTGGQTNGILSIESKLKISNTLKAKYASGEIISKGNPHSPSILQRIKISNTLKNKYKHQPHPTIGKNNGMYGKHSWNKGKVALNKDKIEKRIPCTRCCSDHAYGNEHKCIFNINYKYNKIGTFSNLQKQCKYCNKLFYNKGNGFTNYYRWHNDNCKHK